MATLGATVEDVAPCRVTIALVLGVQRAGPGVHGPVQLAPDPASVLVASPWTLSPVASMARCSGPPPAGRASFGTGSAAARRETVE